MKKWVLGIVMTGSAWLVGVTAGLLLALIISKPLNALFYPDEWGLTGAVIIAMILLPILGGTASITLCWRRVYKRTDGFAKSGRTLRCLECGYMLLKNTSGSCPECGKCIDPKQQSYIDQIERRHA